MTDPPTAQVELVGGEADLNVKDKQGSGSADSHGP
jgi:hypothetical protein